MKSIKHLSALALCGALFVPAAEAASGTWTNLNGGSWTNAANWSEGTPAGGQDSVAEFGTLSLASSPTVTLDGDTMIGSVNIGDLNLTNSWTFNAGNPGSATLTLKVASGTPAVSVGMPNSGPLAQLNAALAGSAGLDKQGQGLLILGHTNNPLTGAVSVSGGVLSTLNNSLSLPNVSGITVASGAQFMLGVVSGNGGTFTNGNPITLAGGGAPGYVNAGSDLFIRGNSTTNYLTNAITLTGPATIGVNGIGTVCHLSGGSAAPVR